MTINGDRVKRRHSRETGTVVERVKGNVADSFLVEWDHDPRQGSWTWEPEGALEEA
jgi:hypothetical protein